MHVTHLNLISMNALFESRSRYERRPCSIHPDLRYHRQEAIPAMRIQLSHAQKEQELYREGSVPLHGFRPTDIPGKSSRHRSVPSLPGKFALRDGHSRVGDSNQSRLRERVSGLACLFRTRSDTHSQGSKIVRVGSIHCGDRRDCIRYRRFHNRPGIARAAFCKAYFQETEPP